MTSQIFRVVFEDPSLLVIEKLRPFLSQRAGNHEGLDEFLARTRKEQIFAVHRLDREVLGLMIYGRTRVAAEELSRQFKQRVVEKKYEALVRGKVSQDEARLEHYLKKNEKTNYVTVFPRPTEGAKKAVLTYEVKERLHSTTRLLVHLETGRAHQIRAQLAKIGHPIVGDQRYGRSESDGEIQLRSVWLSVLHPQTRERMNWQIS